MQSPPFVPTPAPALISPVGISSTFILIIFKLFCSPSVTSDSTVLKIFRDLILAIDLSKFSFVKGSPSSKIISPLITSSLVILFPVIFILSRTVFSPSNTFKVMNYYHSYFNFLNVMFYKL